MFRNYSSPYNNNNGGSVYPARDEFDTRDNLTARRNSAEARRNNNLDVQPQSRRITKMMNCMNIAFFILLICGAALTAVITLIAKPDDDKGNSTTITSQSTEPWSVNETTTCVENSTEITSTASTANITASTADVTEDATTSGKKTKAPPPQEPYDY